MCTVCVSCTACKASPLAVASLIMYIIINPQMGRPACHTCIDSVHLMAGLCVSWAMLNMQCTMSAAILLRLLSSRMWWSVHAIGRMSAGFARLSAYMSILPLMQASNDLMEAFENPQVIRHPRGRPRLIQHHCQLWHHHPIMVPIADAAMHFLPWVFPLKSQQIESLRTALV